ncbi:Protein hinderin [Hondaea fermentalgiana]|uniref:Protein hinderin n=1 Tax=Hondaea fermentalgiana TaxID=2315210 RepID=A0A2R5G8Y7_9STRA|nr:Protein hinderin [Hondaea fermentalgiana]|eukprot:GBG26238.1 Protein hinderin [Hondaea fermentalgiana]
MEDSIRRLLQDNSTHRDALSGALNLENYTADIPPPPPPLSSPPPLRSASKTSRRRNSWLADLDQGPNAPNSESPSMSPAPDADRCARIADLRDQDKAKLARLIQQLVKVTKEKERLSDRLGKVEVDLSSRVRLVEEENVTLRTRCEELKKKFAQSLTMIKTYQDKLTEMEAELRRREDLDSQRAGADDEMRHLREEVVRLRALVMDQAQAQALAQARAERDFAASGGALLHMRDAGAVSANNASIGSIARSTDGSNHVADGNVEKKNQHHTTNLQHAQTQASILSASDLEWDGGSPRSGRNNAAAVAPPPHQGQGIPTATSPSVTHDSTAHAVDRDADFLRGNTTSETLPVPPVNASKNNEIDHQQLLEALTRESKRGDDAPMATNNMSAFEEGQRLSDFGAGSAAPGDEDSVLESFLVQQRDNRRRLHQQQKPKARPTAIRTSSTTDFLQEADAWPGTSVAGDESSIFESGEDGILNHDAFESSQFETSLFDIVDELEGRLPSHVN